MIIHPAAASDFDGEADLHRPLSHKPTGPSRANSIVRRDRKMNLANGQRVRVIDFAAFLRGLPRPAKLIKVDVEGAEWSILSSVRASALDRFEAMFVETHERFDRKRVREALAWQRFAASIEHPYINLFWG